MSLINAAGRAPTAVWSASLAVLLIALAELASRQGWVSPLVLPAPTSVLQALIDGFSSGVYWRHLASTLFATLGGLAIAFVIALFVAGVLVTFPWLDRVVTPFIIAFQSLPKIAVAPLIVLWLGFDNLAKVTIVAVVSFFPLLINALQGFRIRDRDHLDLMKSLGATRWQMFRYLRAKSAAPYIAAGLHIAAIFALIGAVVAEFVGTRAGLGYLLLTQKAAFNVPSVMAILILLMFMGITLYAVTRAAEHRFAAWATELPSQGI